MSAPTCCGKKYDWLAAGGPLVNACQLCRNSPTYWREAEPTPAPAVAATAAAPQPARQIPPGLSWRDHSTGDPLPCWSCGKPAFMRDESGRPRHKTCAEDELRAATR